MRVEMRQVRTEDNLEKFGRCVICGDRVHKNHDYVTAQEGYCHKSCLPEA